MSTRLKLFSSFLWVASIGCASSGEVQSVPFSEWGALPEGCSELIEQSADAEILLSPAEGRADGVVLETPSQACVDSGEQVSEKAAADRRFDLFDRVRSLLAVGDPSPHPDEPTGEAPQTTQRGTQSDPSPHPDKDDEANIAAAIVKAVGFIPRGTAGMSNPPPPEPSASSSGD